MKKLTVGLALAFCVAGSSWVFIAKAGSQSECTDELNRCVSRCADNHAGTPEHKPCLIKCEKAARECLNEPKSTSPTEINASWPDDNAQPVDASFNCFSACGRCESNCGQEQSCRKNCYAINESCCIGIGKQGTGWSCGCR